MTVLRCDDCGGRFEDGDDIGDCPANISTGFHNWLAPTRVGASSFQVPPMAADDSTREAAVAITPGLSVQLVRLPRHTGDLLSGYGWLACGPGGDPLDPTPVAWADGLGAALALAPLAVSAAAYLAGYRNPRP